MDGAREGGTYPGQLLRKREALSESISGRAFLFFVCLLLPTPGDAQVRPIELEGFIVSGTPVPRTAGTVTSHVSVLDGEELRSRGLTRLADALSEIPGLVVLQGGSYGGFTSTFFRGAESDHMKVLVDGVEMNQAGGGFDFSGLVLSDVDRIEVVRGPASALYGSDAMAGVIHIITHRGRGPTRASVSAGGGSYGRVNLGATVQGGGGNSGYSLSYFRERFDGIWDFNNRFENSVLSGKIFTVQDQKTRLELSGRYSDRTYHYPTDDGGKVVDRNAFTFGKEWSMKAEAGHMILPRLEAVASLKTYSWDGGADDRSDGPADTLGYYGFVSDDAFRRRVGDFRLNLTPWAGSALSVGFELEQERQVSETESFSQWGESTGREAFERWNRGYYSHLVSEVSNWAGNIGVRWDDSEQYGRFFTHQMGISYFLSTIGTRFRGSVGKGLKEPTFLETSSKGFSVGNPDLDPERSRVWEVGLEQTLGAGGLTASLTWFRQTLEDLIQYTFTPPDPAGPNYFNVAKARTQGLEAALAVRSGDLNLSASYTYLDSEVLDAGFDEGAGAVFVTGEPMIRRPRHQGSFAASYSLPRLVLSGDLRWTGSRGDRDFSTWPAQPVELSAYLLAALGVRLNLFQAEKGRPGVDVEVRGENVLNQEYQGVFGFDAPGRALAAGVRIQFGGTGTQ